MIVSPVPSCELLPGDMFMRNFSGWIGIAADERCSFYIHERCFDFACLEICIKFDDHAAVVTAIGANGDVRAMTVYTVFKVQEDDV